MRKLLKRLIPFMLIVALLLPCLPFAAEAAYISDPDAIMMQDVLDTLGSSAYRNTYERLVNGSIIRSGSSGKLAKGLLKLLDAMGEDVNVDGKVNTNALECMRYIQGSFGLQKTSSLDLNGYKELLFCLLVYKDASNAKSLLVEDWNHISLSEYNYMRGCSYYLKSRYYKAKTYFEMSGWGDYASRAASCSRSWPSDGKVWVKGSYKGSYKFTVKVSGSSSSWATAYKIYSKSGNKHIATLFIGGDGKASVKLKGGTYYVKTARGQDWYGKKDFFGDDVDFKRFVTDNGKKSWKLGYHGSYIYKWVELSTTYW